MEHDDLEATQTEGYKPGEKKTLDEYSKLDAEDEALNKWKASLGITGAASGGSIGEPGDMRKVVILGLYLRVQGRDDVVMDLSSIKPLTTLQEIPGTYVMKEGCEYQLAVRFRVQHELVSGLKYLQATKKMGVRLDKLEEMMGSYGPNTKENPHYEKAFQKEDAPSGMMARSTYTVQSKFVDDDNHAHLEFKWKLEIKKDWS